MTANDSLETVVEIKHLTKDYQTGFFKQRTVRALDDLSLKVYRGEIFGFLGPNGAGKTTTLKLLVGLIYPTHGTAFILGNPITHVETRARIGYLPENPYFYDYLSGRELLHYTGALFGLPNEAARQRTNELLKMVGLEPERADRHLRKYSKGMLQRIGIAQALMNDPEIVFLDEPMSGLDPIGRREVRDLMIELRRNNKTVFFSSHILSDVEALCDRAAIRERGTLRRCGSVLELTASGDDSREIVATGLDDAALASLSKSAPPFQVASATLGGVRLIIQSEADVEEIIAAIRREGGKLVSINPRRSSLEDAFQDRLRQDHQ